MNTKPDTLSTIQAMPPAPQRTASPIRLTLACALVAFATGCPASTDTTPDGGGMVQATFTSLYGDYLGNCKQCHAPGAPGHPARGRGRAHRELSVLSADQAETFSPSPTSSAANTGNRSSRVSAQRYSIATFSPST